MQATLLYLPKSRARMVSAALVLAVVVIVQAPWVVGELGWVVTLKLPLPHGLHEDVRRRGVHDSRWVSWCAVGKPGVPTHGGLDETRTLYRHGRARSVLRTGRLECGRRVAAAG